MNLVTVEKIRNKSRITELSYKNPIRIFQTEANKNYASVVLSNHGGGMLQGDIMDININCKSDARVVIGNQANTHIFKNKMNNPCKMSLKGDIESLGEVVFKGEPVVMHKDSIYQQDQTWNLKEDSSLFLIDWMQSGRSESGERFNFNHYSSKMSIYIDNSNVFREKFACIPTTDNPYSFASFMGMDHIVTIVIIGEKFSDYINRIKKLKTADASRIYPLTETRDEQLRDIYFSMHPLKKCNGWVIRLLGKTRNDFKDFLTI